MGLPFLALIFRKRSASPTITSFDSFARRRPAAGTYYTRLRIAVACCLLRETEKTDDVAHRGRLQRYGESLADV